MPFSPFLSQFHLDSHTEQKRQIICPDPQIRFLFSRSSDSHSPFYRTRHQPPHASRNSFIIDILYSTQRSGTVMALSITSSLGTPGLLDTSPFINNDNVHQNITESNAHKFTLRQLRESRNIQDVHEDTQELLQLIEKLPGLAGLHDAAILPPTDDDELLSMMQLANNISSSLAKVITSKRESSLEKKKVASPHPAHGFKRRRNIPSCTKPYAAPAPARCTLCDTTDTPQWRPGPSGPSSLCNVCGLVYRKRKARRSTPAQEHTPSSCFTN
ncbi:hypothetical protein F5Y15DRAFT_396275 [Xylariaceae sp. FL0016]|nr:hypothetical protein F5Y15DRAFT_396275 [Xylariaceae sp. FL0016]